MIESTCTLRFDDVEDVPGLLPLLRAVQRSRMRSRERSGRRPGNEATFDLVSQKSINYACVVKVRHTPKACAYVTYATTPTNFRIAQELQFQHADCTNKVHTKCPTVLYASSFSSHPHWPYIAACNITAGGSNKSSVQSMKFTRHLISNSSLACSQGVVLHMCGNIILRHADSPLFPAQYFPISGDRGNLGPSL